MIIDLTNLQKAENGDIAEQYRAGRVYRHVFRDREKARYWFIRAAEHGHIEAQLALADMYFYGELLEQNYTEAIKWYQEAAKRGNAEAQLIIGTLLFDGKLIEKDMVASYMWLSMVELTDPLVKELREPTIKQLEQQLTPEEINTALARACIIKNKIAVI